MENCHSNTAIGNYSMQNITSATYNVAVGMEALQALTSGSENVAVGYQALEDNTSGTKNTAVGRIALWQCNTGDMNTAIGREAGRDMTTGDGNTFLGRSAGEQATTGNNNTFIGQDAGRSGSPGGEVSTGADQVCLGNAGVTHFYCKVSLTATSDARDKTDITDFTHGLSWINKLRPVTYRWDERSNYADGIPNGTHKKAILNLGLLAQEELEIEKEHGYGNDKNDMLITNLSDDGNQYSMKYERLVPILINAVKELSSELNSLKAEVHALKAA